MPEKKQQKREDFTMIITTTPSVEGRAIREYKVLGADNGMLMVTASGTAVVVD